jgi:hypothetical protein
MLEIHNQSIYIYAQIKFNVGQILVIHISECGNHHYQFILCGAQSQYSYHQCWSDHKIIMLKIIREVLIPHHRWVK